MRPGSTERRLRGWGRGRESRREVPVGTASDGSPESLSSCVCTEPYYLLSKLVYFLLLKSTLVRYNLYIIKCIHFKDIVV